MPGTEGRPSGQQGSLTLPRMPSGASVGGQATAQPGNIPSCVVRPHGHHHGPWGGAQTHASPTGPTRGHFSSSDLKRSVLFRKDVLPTKELWAATGSRRAPGASLGHTELEQTQSAVPPAVLSRLHKVPELLPEGSENPDEGEKARHLFKPDLQLRSQSR